MKNELVQAATNSAQSHPLLQPPIRFQPRIAYVMLSHSHKGNKGEKSKEISKSPLRYKTEWPKKRNILIEILANIRLKGV